ncbi:hypothetical protein AAG906_015880 [Vitis piasezkii]
MWTTPGRLVVLALVCLFGRCEVVYGGSALKGVSYDGRSLIVNGKRGLLFSGSIHYPRSIPEVLYPRNVARHGGLNVIHTYAFWNLHEPVQGQDHMKRFTRMIIDMMSKEKLFASQGGPIILALVDSAVTEKNYS